MKTEIISIEQVAGWVIPACQRPLTVNSAVMLASEKMKVTEHIEGIITLGTIKGDATIYIVDGQHRIEAFRLSGLSIIIVDIREVVFDSYAELAQEFERQQSHLVAMRPDDKLRAMESYVPALAAIRNSCEFIGYDNVRRNANSSPILGMSVLIRAWMGAVAETPVSNGAGKPVAMLARSIDAGSQGSLIAFLHTAHAAWGRDPEYYRLWGMLNLCMCMWMFRRLVLDRDRTGVKRYAVLNISEFKQCLMAVSADGDYLSWLRGRNMTERDRSPCYLRLKSIFIRRLCEGSKDQKKAKLPSPAWSSR